jgi:hypothetical protein
MEGGRFGTFRKSAVRVDSIIVSHKIDGKKYEYKKIFSIGLTLLRLNYNNLNFTEILLGKIH